MFGDVNNMFVDTKEGEPAQKQFRYAHIDLLKTIAIFFVIIYHGTFYDYDITNNRSLLTLCLYYGRTIFSICVPVFFFVNGYLLLNRNFDLKKHLEKCLKYIALTFIWGFILMLIHTIMAGEALDIGTVALGVFKIDKKWSLNHLWFMGALICIYIVFPLLKNSFDSDRRSFLFFTASTAVLTFGYVLVNQLMTFSGYVFHHNITSIKYPLITMFNPFRGSYGYTFVYFCVGGLTKQCEERILSTSAFKRNIISVAGIILSCFFLFLIGVFFSLFNDKKLWDVVWNGYNTVFTFFNVFLIYVLSLSLSNVGNLKLVQWISRNTLGIYFIHVSMIRLSRPWMLAHPKFCTLPGNVVYAFIIMLICLMICFLLKKLPILRHLL